MRRFPAILVALPLLLLPSPAGADGGRSLLLERRVAASRALDEVRYRHRTWPEGNPGPKPTFEEALLYERSWQRGEDELRMTRALVRRFGLAVTGDEIRTELERITASSKNPERLREYFAALDFDPVLIAEVLVRPVLVEAKLRQAFAYDPTLQAATRTAAREAIATWGLGPELRRSGASWTERTFELAADGSSTGDAGPGEPELLPADDFAFELARATSRAADGLVEEDDALHVTVILDSGRSRFRIAEVSWAKPGFDQWWQAERENHSADDAILAPAGLALSPLSAGACAAGNAWSATSTSGVQTRMYHTAVWTGSEMIVWGGWTSPGTLSNFGNRYDPATDTWTGVQSLNAPTPRRYHLSAWNGSRLLIWGGEDAGGTSGNGGRWDPTTILWDTTSNPSMTGTNAPAARNRAMAAHTGSTWIVYGGFNSTTGMLGDGGVWDEATKGWKAMSSAGAPGPKQLSVAAWSGSEFIVWGGRSNIGNWGQYASFTGGRYNPVTDTWAALPTTNAPENAYAAGAAWVCDRMVVWGGNVNTSVTCNQTRAGAMYFPATDSWTRMPTTGAGFTPPVNRDIFGQLVRVGAREILSFGGHCLSNSQYYPDVVRFDALSNSWVNTAGVSGPVPSGRRYGTVVAAGDQMIAFGGDNYPASNGNTPLATGGVYCAAASGCPFHDAFGCPLTLTATGGSASVAIRGVVTLDVAIQNPRSICSGAITATFTIPAGLSFTSGAGCVLSGSTATCSLPSLAAGDSSTFPLVLAAGDLAGTFHVPMSLATPSGAAGGATGSVTVVADPALTVTKVAGAANAVEGTPVTWTVTVTNSGATTAGSVTVDDTLPFGLSSSGDSASAHFAAGTFASTTWNGTSNAVELLSPSTAGTFDSRVLDLGASRTLTSIGIGLTRPAGVPLPGRAGADAGFAAGGVDMNGNRLLFHVDEASGATTFADASGLGLAGTCFDGSCPRKTAGILGNAFSFDGDDAITLSNTKGIPSSGPYTLEAWINPNALDGALGIVGWGTYGIADRSVNALRLGSSCGGGLHQLHNYWWGADLIACVPLQIGRWSHVAATYDGTTRRLFVDGAQVGSDTPGAPAWGANPAVSFAIGRTWGSEYFIGAIDEVAISARALSAAELADHYRRGALSARFQVASCPDAACGSPSFVGPDGTSATAFDIFTGVAGGRATAAISGVPASRWFRYRMLLGSRAGLPTPGVTAVSLGWTASASASVGTCAVAGAIVSCSLGDLAPGSSRTVTVTTDAGAVGTLSNGATASATVAGTVRAAGSGAGSVSVVSGSVDSDGDGTVNAVDCRPFDGATWAAPSEARELRLTKEAGGALAWQAPSAPGGTAPLYDVLGSPDPADWGGANCAASGLSATTLVDASGGGELVCYLVRARNACGAELGTDSAGSPHAAPECESRGPDPLGRPSLGRPLPEGDAPQGGALPRGGERARSGAGQVRSPGSGPESRSTKGRPGTGR